jgi:hypothetical protein
VEKRIAVYFGVILAVDYRTNTKRPAIQIRELFEQR